jgi:hypothetical protein
MALCDDTIRERLDLREQILSQQSDTLDVKASIILVAVTFLASHSMYVLEKHIGSFIRYDQILSVALQIVAGIVIAFHLRIRTYSSEAAEELSNWRDEIVKQLGNHAVNESKDVFCAGLIQRAQERIKIAERLNQSKARMVHYAYVITLAAFACNLAAAVSLLF